MKLLLFSVSIFEWLFLFLMVILGWCGIRFIIAAIQRLNKH